MNRLRIILAVVIGLVLIIGITFFVVGSLRPQVAGIYVETNPGASVFINGEEVGRTPYRNTVKPGETVVKLIPDSFQVPLVPYETKINLVAGVETVVRYDFGEIEETSAGEVISFEKVQKDEVSLVVVSIPDSAELIIDAVEKSFTPHKTSAVSAGEHRLKISAKGYVSREFQVKTHQGYKLTAIVNLAKDKIEAPLESQEVKSETQEVSEEKPKAQIEILSTPIGFLRVRKEPSTLGEEVGRVSPGERYEIISEDEKTGWFKIEFEEEKTGWISNQYAKKVQDSQTPTLPPKVSPSVSPKKTPTPIQTP